MARSRGRMRDDHPAPESVHGGLMFMRPGKRSGALIGCLALLASIAGRAQAAGYLQTNLVTDGSDPAITAAHTDPNLVNPWGISFIPGASPFWVSDNNAGVATLYDGTGAPFLVAPNVPLVVDIPLPPDTGGRGGAPTGQVANFPFLATGAFPLEIPGQGNTTINTGSALFIFATEDGTIEGWNLALAAFGITGIPDPEGTFPISDDALVVVDNSASGAVYKGLALATRMVSGSPQPFLYATNFRTGNIDVFDSGFNQVTVPGTFTDPKVQHGYAPFGIQPINGQLWVTYALQDAARHDPVNKPGHGFVSVFDNDGNLVSHFTQHGHLSSPWGVALAPASFGQFGGDILVGNFGNGMINAFDPANGHWLGMVSDADGKPIVNPGLWSVTFSGPAGANAVGSDPDTLYITAGLLGPTHEDAGLFAKISPN
jgi:uncharacterized protein (TIGR03118 family)